GMHLDEVGPGGCGEFARSGPASPQGSCGVFIVTTYDANVVSRHAGRVVDDGTARPHLYVPQSAEVQGVVVQTFSIVVRDAAHSLEQDRVVALQEVVASAGSQAIRTARGLDVVLLRGNSSQGSPDLPVAALEDEMPDFHEVSRAARDHLVSHDGALLG